MGKEKMRTRDQEAYCRELLRKFTLGVDLRPEINFFNKLDEKLKKDKLHMQPWLKPFVRAFAATSDPKIRRQIAEILINIFVPLGFEEALHREITKYIDGPLKGKAHPSFKRSLARTMGSIKNLDFTHLAD